MKKNMLEQEQLGNLELNLLKILWQGRGWLDVKDVVAQMDDPRAYTTVMTTLARLHKKGFVDQKKIGRAFVYRPRVTQKAVIQGVLGRIAQALFNGDLRQLMPQILDIQEELSQAERDKLEAMAKRIKDRDAP